MASRLARTPTVRFAALSSTLRSRQGDQLAEEVRRADHQRLLGGGEEGERLLQARRLLDLGAGDRFERVDVAAGARLALVDQRQVRGAPALVGDDLAKVGLRPVG